jgi:hypothetical protein
MPHSEPDTNCYLPSKTTIAAACRELRKRRMAKMKAAGPKAKATREPPNRIRRRGSERGAV